MRRLLIAAVALAATLALVSPAATYNTGNQPPGPPANSYGPHEQGTWVMHCQAYNYGAGAIVFTPAGPGAKVNDNCRY